MNIRILLADDHKIVRDGVRSLIDKEPDMDVVAEAGDGRTAVQLAQELSPAVVVMDIGMPDLNGMEAARQIVDAAPNVRVLALSMYADRRFVSEMLRAGASGYLPKKCAFEELAGAIRAVAAGRIYLSPAISEVVVKDYVRRLADADAPAPSRLSAREREVLQLLAEGHSTKEIAVRLGVSAKTIETHRRRIMDKLDLHSVAELTKYAVREGLSELDV
jgi:two-component system response regulator NreC